MKAIIDKAKANRDGFPQTFTGEEVDCLLEEIANLRATLRTVANELGDVDGEIVDVAPLLDRIERALK